MITAFAITINLLSVPIIGSVTTPTGVSDNIQDLTPFISNLLIFAISIGGIYTLINIVIAGYKFITAGGDAQAITSAWSQIYQSIIGLAIIAGALAITAIISLIIFKDPGAIMRITIYGPTTT